MEQQDHWVRHIQGEIEKHRETFTKKEQKKYRLDLVMRLAKRVSGFSHDCTECTTLQWEIKRNAESLTSIIRLSGEEQKRYRQSISHIAKHLQKQHRLVPEGYYKRLGIAAGAVAGIALGFATRNYALSAPAGVSLGATIGQGIDKKAKKEDRVI